MRFSGGAVIPVSHHMEATEDKSWFYIHAAELKVPLSG